MNDLDKVRGEIDDIDSELLRLLNRRMEVAVEAGLIKVSMGLPLFHPEREQIVFQRLLKLNPGPLSGESLHAIYREIFAASRLLQGLTDQWQQKTAICGCLVECSRHEFPKWLNHPEADLVEWRMDKFACVYSREEMKSFISALSAKPRLTVIATNRPVREMGSFAGQEDQRLDMLEEAARSGADWIDLEHDASVYDICRFQQVGAKVLLSWHSPAGTPSRKILRTKLEEMRKTGADALKIATLAQSGDDNLRVLELIPLAQKEFGVGLIAFCIGQAGKWSRLVSLLLGSPWAYVQLQGQPATAPGQLLATEMRALIGTLRQD